MRTSRLFTHLQATFKVNTCETEPIDMREYRSMQVSTPSSWTAAAIGFKASPVENTLFKPVYETAPVPWSGSMVAQESSVAADCVYVWDAQSVAGSGFIRLWSQAAGANVNQTAERVLGISLKG